MFVSASAKPTGKTISSADRSIYDPTRYFLRKISSTFFFLIICVCREKKWFWLRHIFLFFLIFFFSMLIFFFLWPQFFSGNGAAAFPRISRPCSTYLTHIHTRILLTLLTFFALPILKKIRIYQIRFLFGMSPGVDSYSHHFGTINK